MAFRPLPIGIDNFEKLRCGGYYYVDKTNFIKELLDMRGEVNLITRPRRFGKTLNMSMLQYYFEDTQDDEINGQYKELFTGLKIIRQGEKYRSWLGSRPVINLSLKSGKQPDFNMAWDSLTDEIRKEFNRHDSIKASGKLLENEIQHYCDIQNGTASKAYYAKSLEFLSFCLAKCYEKKTIILIDEYDVPLENAWIKNFYNEMIDFLRSLFESALKTNPYLEFTVLTGCLRISKESIFTGLNNSKMISILSEAYGEHFGFLQSEVNEMLDFYGLAESSKLLKEWYDGYKFGNAEVCNPWSVISYVDDAVSNKDTLPRPYWNNTSSNTIVRNLIERAEPGIKLEIEQLVAGGVIEKPVHEEVTYDDIHGSEDNLWNFLFFTGYLKKIDLRLIGDDRYVKLALPNREVRHIYNSTIKGWFQETLELKDLNILYERLLNGEAQHFQKELSA